MAEGNVHKDLAAGRWQTMTLMEQLGNIGSEVGRAIRAKTQGNDERLISSLSRALELFDLTVADPRRRYRLREILRAREAVCDFLVGDNVYQSTGDSLDRYFMTFAVAARRNT